MDSFLTCLSSSRETNTVFLQLKYYVQQDEEFSETTASYGSVLNCRSSTACGSESGEVPTPSAAAGATTVDFHTMSSTCDSNSVSSAEGYTVDDDPGPRCSESTWVGLVNEHSVTCYSREFVARVDNIRNGGARRCGISLDTETVDVVGYDVVGNCYTGNNDSTGD